MVAKVVSKENLSRPKPSAVGKGYGEVVCAREPLAIKVALGAGGVVSIAELG